MTADATGSDFPWLAAYPPGVDWAAPIPPESPVALFEASVQRFGDRPCLDFLGRQWRYAEIGALVGRTAAGLQALGVRPGDRVGLCLPNTPYYLIAYFALLKIGGIVVNFNPQQSAEEMADQIRDSGTGLMITIDVPAILGRVVALRGATPLDRVIVCQLAGILPFWKGIGYRLQQSIATWRAIARGRPRDRPTPAPAGKVSGFHRLHRHGALPRPVAIDPAADLALLQYTGGTTGVPKAAMLTHANLAANMRQMDVWYVGCRRGEERVLAILPFFHVFALTVVLNAAMLWGAEMILLPRFEIRELMRTIMRRRPTCLPGVPTLYKAILDSIRRQPADLSSIRQCVSGGAPLPLEVKQAFEAASGCTLVEGYGLTEAAPVCFCNPLVGENKAGSIGLPFPGLVAEIRSLDDPARRLAAGEVGELCVAGPNVMAGYWQRPEDSAAVLVDGFLHTGDVGYMDDQGYVFLVDRIKDLIITAGRNVYPRVIEEAIYRHPQIAAAIVVGMPDRMRGEVPAAFVQLLPGGDLTPSALREFLRGHLTAYELPRLIELRDSLPKTAAGKLSKKELRAELRARATEGEAARS